MPPTPLRAVAKTRIFKTDVRTCPYRVKWEVQRAPAGVEPEALWSLRRAARDEKEAEAGFVACGLRAVARAVERKEAWVVFVCTEGVPSALMQHLPPLCAFQKVPVAVVAATPGSLGSAVAPLWTRKSVGDQHRTVAAALMRRCEARPRLAELCRQLEASLPPVRLPFLLPEGGASLWRPETTPTKTEGPLEGFIHLPSVPRGCGGKARGKHAKNAQTFVGRSQQRLGKGGRTSKPHEAGGEKAPAEAAVAPPTAQQVSPASSSGLAGKVGMKRQNEEPPGPEPKKARPVEESQPPGDPPVPPPKSEDLTISDFFNQMDDV